MVLERRLQTTGAGGLINLVVNRFMLHFSCNYMQFVEVAEWNEQRRIAGRKKP